MQLNINLLVVLLQIILSVTFCGLSSKYDGPSAVTYQIKIENDKMMRYDSDNITMLTFSKSDNDIIDMLKPSHGILTTYKCDVRAFFIAIIMITTLHMIVTYMKTPSSAHRIQKIDPEANYDHDTISENFNWNLTYWIVFGLQTTIYILVLCSPMSVFTLPFMGITFTIFMILLSEPIQDENNRMQYFCFMCICLAYLGFITHLRDDVKATFVLLIMKIMFDALTWMLHCSEHSIMDTIINGRIVMNFLYSLLFVVIYFSWSYT
eukprot:563671-Hanusia_phi.AAC.4